MDKLQKYIERNCMYSGDRADWFVAYARHRDSDNLDNSNWDYIVKALGPEDETFAIERFSHFAVGWLEYALINPMDELRIKAMEELNKRMADYPVLDESDLSRREWEAEEQEEMTNEGQ